MPICGHRSSMDPISPCARFCIPELKSPRIGPHGSLLYRDFDKHIPRCCAYGLVRLYRQNDKHLRNAHNFSSPSPKRKPKLPNSKKHIESKNKKGCIDSPLPPSGVTKQLLGFSVCECVSFWLCAHGMAELKQPSHMYR